MRVHGVKPSSSPSRLTQRGQERLWAGLAAGDPTGEVAAAWQGKELLRSVAEGVLGSRWWALA